METDRREGEARKVAVEGRDALDVERRATLRTGRLTRNDERAEDGVWGPDPPIRSGKLGIKLRGIL